MADAPLPSYPLSTATIPHHHDPHDDNVDDVDMMDDPVPSTPTTRWTKRVQPNTMEYTGGVQIPVTSTLHLVTPQEDVPRGGVWPVFRMMVRG